MPQLSITNVGQALAVIKDPQGYTDFVTEIAGGVTVVKDVSNDLLQRLTPQLKLMETQSFDALGAVLTGIQWTIVNSATEDIRSAPEGGAGLPSLNELRLASYSTGAGNADAVAAGTSLAGGQLFAAKTIANLAGTAAIAFSAVAPGAPGNNISVRFVTPTGSLTVSVVGNRVDIQSASGGSTTAAIVAAVNAHASAKLLVQAVLSIAGTFNEAIAELHLLGGKGPGVSLSIDGTAASLTEVLDTLLTFDLPAGVSAASRIVPLQYRCGPHVSAVSVPVVA
jgi:hypothetical protein